MGYLARFLCAGLALALLATGCAGPRPLKGGRAVTTHKPAGVVEQTLVQGENPSQATKQTQESVKVRTYTVPAGSRVEQSSVALSMTPTSETPLPFPLPLEGGEGAEGRRGGASTINSQLSTLNHLAPERSNARD